MIQRFTHYPAQPSYEDNEFSIAPHTDSGFMTAFGAVGGAGPVDPVAGWDVV